VRIEAGDARVVGHVGLHALAAFGDRIGVADDLGTVVPWTGERAPVHDRGKVLTHAMVMLAGGGNSVADVEHLRVEPVLFGHVASDTTTYRVLRHELTPAVRTKIEDAFGQARRRVWDRSAATTGTAPVVLDIDASLVQIHSENKDGTAPTYKGGFGFHPMFCFADATGEALASVLRPGNAGANSIADHLDVLDRAIAQLPDKIRAGHHVGDTPDLVERAVLVRTDSAGCTTGFIAGCRARNVGFAVVARRTASVSGAIMHTVVNDPGWQPAITQTGEPRPGAARR